MKQNATTGILAIACLLSWPSKSFAQIFLTPLGGRSVVLLNDRLTDCTNEVEALRYNAALDSLELAAHRDALSQAEALQELTEARLFETVVQVDRCELRERELEDAVAKSGKVAKRRARLAWLLAGVAAAEAVVIAVWVGLR